VSDASTLVLKPFWTFLVNKVQYLQKGSTSQAEQQCMPFMLAFGGLQVRRAGALAVTKAVADKQQLDMLDLDANEIPDSAIDDLKVCHLTYALLLDMALPWHGSSVPLLVVLHGRLSSKAALC